MGLSEKSQKTQSKKKNMETYQTHLVHNDSVFSPCAHTHIIIIIIIIIVILIVVGEIESNSN